MNQLLHALSWPMTASDTWVLRSRRKANQTVWHSTCITFNGEFCIPGAQNNSTAVCFHVFILSTKGAIIINTTGGSGSKSNLQKNSPSTRGGAVLAQPTSTKFATHKCWARVTNNLAAIFTLIHFVTTSTIKRIAAIADPNLMVCLELVAPMTSC